MVLEITDLKKSFVSPDGERVQVIDIAHFTLPDGAQVALRGTSGSGKTTFLHLVSGILAPDSGRIIVAGQNLTALTEAQRDRVRATSIGYIFQTFNLLQGFTALENVVLAMTFGGRADYAFAASLLTKVGLQERLNYRPAQLSVGQQQRVAVARALANRPKLILADEPTGNLDERNAKEALALIRAVCREFGAALLLVTHAPEILGQFEEVRELNELSRRN